MNTNTELQIDEFPMDVLYGLSRPHKTLPCKYLYDEQGTFYFERICACEEYYVTRTELAIMLAHAADMASLIGDRCLVMEYGSGAAVKTKILFNHLSDPCAYIPIDISPEYLEKIAYQFAQLHPNLEILPLCADFTQFFDIPRTSSDFKRRLIYFPGSTLGNFSPLEAEELLRNMRLSIMKKDLILLGIDLKKETDILYRAYNDINGYTAAFNLNMLNRVNRELSANFCVKNFYHRAVYNEDFSRIEMHLVSLCDQTATVCGQDFDFHHGESIHTESSYKFDLGEFEALTESAGLHTRKIWVDENNFFAIILLEA